MKSSGNMSKTFIDTDVILDFLIAREPFAMDAARIFTLSEKNRYLYVRRGLSSQIPIMFCGNWERIRK